VVLEREQSMRASESLFRDAGFSGRNADGFWRLREAIAVVVNFLLIGALTVYGFRLFAEYHAKGRWAKNVTSLLAGLGLMTLAAALLLTPQNAAILTKISHTKIARILLWASNTLLLTAIAAFGLITYSRPLRLWHERKIERDLRRELPKIP